MKLLEEFQRLRSGGVPGAQGWAVEVHPQGPRVSISGPARVTGNGLTESRLELRGGAGNSCSVQSRLFSKPGPHFSLLCRPYSFTEHSPYCTRRHSLLEYSPFPPRMQQNQVQNK